MALNERGPGFVLMAPPPQRAGVPEGDENAAPTPKLVLRAYGAGAKVNFGSVHVNGRAEASVVITNPSAVDLTVSVSNVPDQFVVDKGFLVPANGSFNLTISWRPSNTGVVRKTLNVLAGTGRFPIRTTIIVIGTCVDPSEEPGLRRPVVARLRRPLGALSTTGSFENFSDLPAAMAETTASAQAGEPERTPPIFVVRPPTCAPVAPEPEQTGADESELTEEGGNASPSPSVPPRQRWCTIL